MYQGFYELTSSMLTQKRNLNVVSNNMANSQTAGYKEDTQINSTFAEEMVYRTNYYDRSDRTPLATATPIVMAKETVTNYTQGTLEQTDNIYDFAISGEGMFAIETPGGDVLYTRNGSFSVSDGGILQLEGVGAVLDTDGNTITIDSDEFTADSHGIISDAEGNEIAQIGLIDTEAIREENGQLQMHKEDNGMYSYTGDGEPAQLEDRSGNNVLWKTLEGSNVDLAEQMTKLMSAQRTFQSSAQLLKMYDSIMAKASSDIGKV